MGSTGTISQDLLDWKRRRFDRFNDLLFERVQLGDSAASPRREWVDGPGGRMSRSITRSLVRALIVRLDDDIPPPPSQHRLWQEQDKNNRRIIEGGK